MKDSTMENPGRTMWSGAALDGGILGLLLVATKLLNGVAVFRLTALAGVVNFVLLVGCIYVFTRRRSLVYGDAGFSFAQSMGYIIMMMLFTGLIVGIGDYVAMNILWPEYYEGIKEAILESNPFLAQASDEVYDQSVGIMRNMLKGPLFYIISGVASEVLYGGIIGLFVSAFVKRAPQPNMFGNEKE